jgi:hypothetical protein
MANITITLDGSVVNKEKMQAIKKMEQDKQKLIEELRSEAVKHPRYVAAFDLAGYSDFDGRKISPQLVWGGKGFTATVKMDDVKTEKPYVLPVHVDPKTLNALLNGKLLTDSEKRKLLTSVLPADVLENTPA